MNLNMYRTLAEIQDLSQKLKDAEYVAFDTETTGVEKDSEIIGFSVCADTETGHYVILSQWDCIAQKLVPQEAKQGAKAFLEFLTTKALIMHNAVFDVSMVMNNFGVNLMPALHTDTMVLGHLLNENRSNGLKERGIALYGEAAGKEQKDLHESVHKNGGQLTKACYELYKGDADLIGKYGAKDAILTLKLFYNDVQELYDQKLDTFFYDDETMPLLRGPTYDMNTTGLRVDPEKLQTLKQTLEAECLEAKAFIYKEIAPHIKAKYPGTSKKTTFNINANQQLAWLLFSQLGNEFHTLTKSGKLLAKELLGRIPYSPQAKREFIRHISASKGAAWGAGKKVGDPWQYMGCGKDSLSKYAKKYKWVAKRLEYAKNLKLINTYIEGIQSRMKYGIIRPNFLQHGTTSGRYSCKNPNFQNLPRDDKRIKACIISRPGKVFVGADYEQLEPRVFASQSGDTRLMRCFSDGDDFYSVIGVEVFAKHGMSLKKDDPNGFAKQCKSLRDVSKVVGLSATYGTTAFKMASSIGKTADEAQEVIDSYFERFPDVHKFMLDTHEEVKTTGVVYNLYGRPRRIPEALSIRGIYGSTEHARLPAQIRTLLNLAVNHKVQSTAASLMNRAAIACKAMIDEAAKEDSRWLDVKIILQVHDELILEGPIALSEEMKAVLKDAMESSTQLPGVALIANPVIANNLADLK